MCSDIADDQQITINLFFQKSPLDLHHRKYCLFSSIFFSQQLRWERKKLEREKMANAIACYLFDLLSKYVWVERVKINIDCNIISIWFVVNSGHQLTSTMLNCDCTIAVVLPTNDCVCLKVNRRETKNDIKKYIGMASPSFWCVCRIDRKNVPLEKQTIFFCLFDVNARLYLDLTQQQQQCEENAQT